MHTIRLNTARTGYFALTIFLSAFLLFQIQPLISKYILPWFGGGPAVWTAAMMFFQVLLLGGYAYAHFLSRLSLLNQARLHLVVLAAILAYIISMAFTWVTPVTPDPSWKPAGVDFPVWHVVLVLAISVGLPYFLLSTTSSLMQAWFSRLSHQSSPYAFYILSNAASFLALLTYPVLVEPFWTIKQQGGFWSIAFVVYLLLAAGGALLILRNRPTPAKPAQAPGPEDAAALPVTRPPSLRTTLLWIALAACASVMLLAATNQMCQDVASIPFLWVLPLSLYLLSFMIAFDERFLRYRGMTVLLTLFAVGLGFWAMSYGSRSSVWLQIGANALMLLIICVFCHSELYLRRPHPHYLTSFYLMLSVGGALGGVFVNLVAPYLFKDFWEYPLGLVLCAVMVVLAAYQSRGAWLYRLRIPVAVLALSLGVFVTLIPVLWVTKSVGMWRNFYGVIKVRSSMIAGEPSYDMQHGAIVHGSQAIAKPDSLRPTRYYTETSGVGLAITNHPRRAAGQPMRVGVIGLGVGTLAAYGQEGDTFRFYEIDPDVITVAQDTRYFTFLSDSKAQIDIVTGDGRLSLERERVKAEPAYDILVMDAFSGDSIPTHLVSREAVQLYLDLLQPDGVLAFNISNRHLNLEPVLAQASMEMGLHSLLLRAKSADEFGADSTWVLMVRDPAVLDSLGLPAAARPLVVNPAIHLWTDDFSNLFQILW